MRPTDDRCTTRRCVLHAAFAAFLTALCIVYAAHAETYSFAVPRSDIAAAGASAFSLTIELDAAGCTFVRAGDNDTALRATAVCPKDGRIPLLKTGVDNGTFTAVLSSGTGSADESGAVQQWRIELGPPVVPIDLTMRCSATDGSGDFGGIALRSCALVLQQCSFALTWSVAQQHALQVLVVAARDSSVTLTAMGNANFAACGMLGAGSTMRLDLSGGLSDGDHAVTMLQTGGESDATLPGDLGAKVTARSLLSQITVGGSGWRQRVLLPVYRAYATDDYLTRDRTATFDITAVAAQVRINRENP